jgi:hypothetical protein
MSDKQLRDLLNAKAKGIVTRLATYAEKMLKYAISTQLYGRSHTSGRSGSYYDRTGYFLGSVQRNRTEYEDDGFNASAYFDIDYLDLHSAPPIYKIGKRGGRHLVKFGRYTDIYGNFIGDGMVEGRWLEDGTDSPSIVPRSGAGFMMETISLLDEFMSGYGIDAMVSEGFNGIEIERIK